MKKMMDDIIKSNYDPTKVKFDDYLHKKYGIFVNQNIDINVLLNLLMKVVKNWY